jgi:signal transduction histidine kinase
MLDHEKIAMVMTHLLSNAVDAMKNQNTKHLRISTEKVPASDKAGESVRLVISDTGHGIKEEDMARIFDPFFTTKDPDKGKGLGLAVSYGIIREHGGRIWAENNEWGGATFIIELPIRESLVS